MRLPAVESARREELEVKGAVTPIVPSAPKLSILLMIGYSFWCLFRAIKFIVPRCKQKQRSGWHGYFTYQQVTWKRAHHTE